MRKRFIQILMCAFLLTQMMLPAAAMEGESHSVVVPFVHDRITYVSTAHKLLTVDTGRRTDGKELYNFDGKLLLQADELVLQGDWLVVKKSTGMGVYGTDLKEIVPCVYGDISLLGDAIAIAVEPEHQNRLLYWSGNRHCYGLTTGEIIAECGYGSAVDTVVLPDGNAEKPTIWFELHSNWGKDGDYVSACMAMENDRVSIWNEDGQMLLSSVRCDSVWSDAARRYYCISERASNSVSHYSVYSGRGRLLVPPTKQECRVLCDGQYIAIGDMTIPSVMLKSWDGEIVFQCDMFTSLRGKCVDPSVGVRYSDDPMCLIAEKGGKYGVIRMQEYQPRPSDWAVAETKQAVAGNLVDSDIQWWWRESCTREEFCRMVIRGVEKTTGKTVKELTNTLSAVTFTDCHSEAVAQAAVLGIVDGIGAGKFAPGRFVTRQEAAVMLARAATYLGYQANAEPMAFGDAQNFAPWAAESIAMVSSLLCGERAVPLMQGKSEARFAPLDPYTVEQAAATVLRLVQYHI